MSFANIIVKTNVVGIISNSPILQLFRQIDVSYVLWGEEEDKTWDFQKNDGSYGSLY